MANDNLKTLYNSLKRDNYDVPETYDRFEQALTKDEDHLSKRETLYNSLKRDNYDVPDTYETFSTALFDYPWAGDLPGGEGKHYVNFNSTQSQAQPAEPATSTEPAWQPTEQEQAAMAVQVRQIGEDGQRRLKAVGERGQRALERFAPSAEMDGRRKAMLAGANPFLMGITRKVSTPQVGEDAGVEAPAEEPMSQSLLLASQRPIAHDVKWVDGKRQIEWLLPDGTLTTDRMEADRMEGSAKEARGQYKFVRAMERNGLDPKNPEDVKKQAQIDYEAPIKHAVNAVWDKAEAASRAEEEEIRDFGMMSPVPGNERAAVLQHAAGGNRWVESKHLNLQKLTDEAWGEMSDATKASMIAGWRQYYTANAEEIPEGKTLEQAAQGAAKNEVYAHMYERAYGYNLGRENFLSNMMGNTLFGSIGNLLEGYGASKSGDMGLYAAKQAAKEQWSSEHPWQSAFAFAGGMAIDPTTYLSMGASKYVATPILNGVARLAFPKVAPAIGTKLMMQSLTGRIFSGVAQNAAFMSTFDGLKSIEHQLTTVNPETGELNDFSAEDVLNSWKHGAIVGGLTGWVTPTIGNVADAGVKAADRVLADGAMKTAGMSAIRGAEAATSALLEGTIFAGYDIYENSRLADDDPNKRSNTDIWSQSMAFIVGAKAVHSIKAAPQVVREFKAKDVREHRTLHERIQSSLMRSPKDLVLTRDELDELRIGGYGKLADIFSKENIKAADDGKASDEYESLERLMEDNTISEAARAKVYYIAFNRQLPPSTVMGYDVSKDGNGRYVVKAMAADGGVVIRRTFKSESAANGEVNRIKRQVELNTIDVGERFADNQAIALAVEDVIDDVAKKHHIIREGVENIFERYSKGEQLSGAEASIVEDLLKSSESQREKYAGYSAQSMREILNERYGVDIDEALRKTEKERSAQEQEAVQTYAEMLYGEANRLRTARKVWGEEAERWDKEERDERLRAWRMQMEGKLLGARQGAEAGYSAGKETYGRYEQADPEAQAEIDAIYLRYEEAHNDLADRLDEATFSEVQENPWAFVGNPDMVEHEDALLYYINSRAAYEGVANSHETASQSKRANIEHEIGQRTHKDSGLIVPATLKVDDKPVYIVKGEVNMFPDGSAVDVRNSSESVIIYDPEAKEVKMISPEAIFKVDMPLDAQEQLATALSALEAEPSPFDNMAGVDLTAQSSEGDTEFTPADTAAYDKGYEDGIEVVSHLDDTALNSAIEDLRGRESLTDEWRGRLEAYEYEQQRRAQEGVAPADKPADAVEQPQIIATYTDRKGTKSEVYVESDKTDNDGVRIVKIRRKVTKPTDDRVRDVIGGLVINEADIDWERSLNGVDANGNPKSTEIYEDEKEGLQDAWSNAVTGAKQDFRAEEIRFSPDGKVIVARNVEGVTIFLNRDPLKPEAPAEEAPQGTALSRIPVEGDEPQFTKVDAVTGWDGLVEMMQGDEKGANEIVLAQIQQARDELEKLKKKPPTLKAPTLKGSPMAMAKARTDAQAKYDADLATYNNQLATLQADIDAWTRMSAVYNSRNAEARAAADAERQAADAAAHDAAVARFEEEQRIKAEKEAEQAAVGIHAVNPKLIDRWQKAKKTMGGEYTYVLPNGTPLKGHWALVEAGTVVASHNPFANFAKTDGFPIDEHGNTVNDRDYERDTDAQERVHGMAARYDSRALQSPVIVSPDGIVLSGNNRTMSGEIAAKAGTDGAYLEILKGDRDFTPEQIAEYEHPRKVLVLDEPLPYTTKTFADFNARDTKSQNNAEVTIKSGKTVSDEAFNQIVRVIAEKPTLRDFYRDDAASAMAIGLLRSDSTLGEDDIAQYYSNGRLSELGEIYLEGVLVGKSLQGHPDATRMAINDKTMRTRLVNALLQVADNRTLPEDFRLTDELAKAIDLVYRAKESDKNAYVEGRLISPFGGQAGLFDDEFGASNVENRTILMLADLLNHSREAELRRILEAYNRDAKLGAAGQLDIFNNVDKKEDILNRQVEAYDKLTAAQRAKQEADDRAGRQASEAARLGEGDGSSEQVPAVDERNAGGAGAGQLEPKQPSKYDRTAPATPEAQRGAISRIVDFAAKVKDRVERAVIGAITPRQIKDLAKEGIDIDESWVHSFETSAVTHNQNNHGDAKTEERVGQLPITADDYARIPEILEAYDKVSKSPNRSHSTGNDVIIYEKEFDDGYVYYLEEKRDKRKSLSFQTMYKKKKGTDSSDGLMPNASPSTPTAPSDNFSSKSGDKVSTLSQNKQESGIESSAAQRTWYGTEAEMPATPGLSSTRRMILFNEAVDAYKEGQGEASTYDAIKSGKEFGYNEFEKIYRDNTREDTFNKTVAYLPAIFEHLNNRFNAALKSTRPKVQDVLAMQKEAYQAEVSKEPKWLRKLTTNAHERISPEDGVTIGDLAKYIDEYRNGWQPPMKWEDFLAKVNRGEVSKEEAEEIVPKYARHFMLRDIADQLDMAKSAEEHKNDPQRIDDEWGDYSITPSTYTNKAGKTSDMFIVKIERNLTPAEQKAIDAFVKAPLAEGKKTSRGWFDRKQGGYMMRSEEAARQLGNLIDNPEAMADAQPLSREDIAKAAGTAPQAPAKQEAPRPANKVESLDELDKYWYTKGRTLSQSLKEADLPAHYMDDMPDLEVGKTYPTEEGTLEVLALRGAEVTVQYRKGGEGRGQRMCEPCAVVGRMIKSDLSDKSDVSDGRTRGASLRITDAMKAEEDILRDLLGIDDDEVSDDVKFRDPGELTPEQKRKVYAAGVNYALGYFDQNITAFPDFAAAMVGRLGAKIKPWLKSFYEGAKRIPGYDESQFTPSEEVDKFDVANFDKPSADMIAAAETRLAERKAEAASQEAEQSIIEQRNQQRKEEDDKTTAGTVALAEEAGAVASEAESNAGNAGAEQLEKIDKALDKVNERLALLGHYESGEGTATAEQRALQDATILAFELCQDLGLNEKALPQGVDAIKSNFHKMGGFVELNLPLRKDLKPIGVTIRFDRKGSAMQVSDITLTKHMGGPTAYIIGAHHTVMRGNTSYSELLGEIRKQFADVLPKEDVFAAADRVVTETKGKKKPQQQQSASSPEGQDLTTSSATDAETVPSAKVRIFSQGEKSSAKYEVEKVRHKYIGKKSTHGFLTDISTALGDKEARGKQSHYFDIQDADGNLFTLRISNHNVNAANVEGKHPEISIVVKSRRQPNRFHSSEEAEVTEYVYFKEDIASGDGQTLGWIAHDISNMLDTGKYADTSGMAVVNRSPEVESSLRSTHDDDAPKTKEIKAKYHKTNWEAPGMTSIWHVRVTDDGKINFAVYAKAEDKVLAGDSGLSVQEWEGLVEMNGLRQSDTTYGYIEKADREADKLDRNARRHDTQPTSEDTAEATAAAVGLLKGGKKTNKVKKVEPEQPLGDLFGGLFDDMPSDNEKTDVQPRTGTAKREGGHEPRPNEPLGESQRDEVKRADGQRVGGRDSVNPLPDDPRGRGVPRQPKSAERIERLSEAERKNTRNNHTERGVDYAPKGEDARIKANIEAIELAQRLLAAGEEATPEQMAILRKFSGWGGLGKAFNEQGYNLNPTAKRLRELLGEQGYEDANGSRRSAYYTPAEVIDTMWDIVKAMGFKGGNILEGSAGIGNILGLMPAELSDRSNIHAVEIDSTTGGILSLLYPDAEVDIQGFEKTKVRNGSIDLAITNVPFITGKRVYDETGDKDLSKKFRNIHDFCIAKNIRKLREGGIGIFISSSGTMDGSKELRRWIGAEGNADVIGAFRMHNKTFGGTGATSDIIVVRKRVNGKPSPLAIDITETTGVRVADYDTGDTRKVKGQEVPIIKQCSLTYNKYFAEHPENMAGEMMFNFERGETRFPTSSALFPTAGKDQSAMLKEWASRFTDMTEEYAPDTTESVEDAVTRINESLGDGVKEGSIVLNSQGELCMARMGEAVPLGLNKNKVKGHTKAECFKAYSAIKKALSDVLEYQSKNEDDAGLDPLLKELNRVFDTFVRTYGNLHKNTAISFLRNDVDFSSILALETYSEKGDKNGNKVVKVGKTDIFSRRVVPTEKEPTPTTIKDGIIASLYKSGELDVDYIAQALGKNADEVKREIVASGLGFENPATGTMEVSYKYLSGNVREKMHIAQENNEDGRFDANIKALEEVMPMTIPSHLIEFTLGSSWLEPKLYQDFVHDKTGIRVKFTNAGGTWYMDTPWSTFNEKNRSMAVTSTLCGKTIMGHELIEAAITNKQITVSKTEKHYDGTSETIVDRIATAQCSTKIDEIRAEFKDWAREHMQADPEMAERIEKTYNEQFNNYVPMSIPEDFVPQHFGGQVSELHGRPFALRPHQGRAVVRATTEPVLLAHEVGTGKTYTLITTAMEMRRLGTARKPMIVVQNATVGQFVESAKEIYPNAKVLTIEEADRTAEGRKNFYAKIKYNDWDMIVVPQSVFERIPDSEEREMAYVQDIIEEKMKILEDMREADSRGNSMIVRNAEREIELQEARLAELTEMLEGKQKKRDEKKEATTRENAEVKALEMLDREVDDVENFDDMGIDAILVDEAHEYKHLGFATAMQRGVKGVDPSYSKKSQGVFLKAQAVLERNNGRNVVFATGTPISNTAAEIWTFMRYLMPADTMKDYGIYYFDDFVRNFGNISQMVEFATNGKFKENNRFAGYVNLPELVRIWSSVADTVLTRDAGGVSDKIPDMEGGKAQDIYLPQTRGLRSVMKHVKAELDRYDKMSGKEKKENSHIPLTMYGIAKAAAVDVRLVIDNAPDEPNSKTNATVRETLRALEDSKKYKGTVAIFADNYQNKRSGFNLYEDIRTKLIAQGVPAEQIVIIKSGMSVKKKLEIFDKVNAGEIRVVMGSTYTLGTGVNIQERLFLEVHVDAPNRPMDYTQRLGRILRQGNLHKDMGIPVRIIRFGVEDSLDVTAYQRLKTKGAIADSIMNGSKMMANSMENRVLEEEEDVFGDMTAQLSGSEYAILKNQAEREVRTLTGKQKNHEIDQTYVYNQLPKVEGFIKGAQYRIDLETKNLEILGQHFADGIVKKITIGKLSFDNVEAMEEFFKEQNAKMNEMAEQIKSGQDNMTSRLTIDFDGLQFEVTTKVGRKVESNGQATLSFDAEREVTYSCEALGIKGVQPKGNRVKNAVQEIVEQIIPGTQSRARLKGAEQQLAHYTEEKRQLDARNGKESPYKEALAEAKARLAKYEELMRKELEAKEAKYAAIDAEVEEATDLAMPDEEGEESDKSMLRPMEEGEPDTEWLESLSDDELVPVFRNVQVLPSKMALASPMAAKDLTTGEYRTIAPRQWNGSYSNVELTEEQQRMYDELAANGYVMIDGKRRTRFDISPERYFEARATKEPALMFKLDKGVDGIVPASENPYDHGKFNTVNLQFATAFKRPNLVMVQSVMPKSELRKMMANDEIAEGMYHAPFAKNSTGIVSWTNGDKLALSRWSKIIRVLTNKEAAERINALWQANPAKSPKQSKDARDPHNYTPQILEYLKGMGWEFDPMEERTPQEIEASYQGMPYVTDEDIAHLNEIYADDRHASLWSKNPDEFLREAEENTMADKVQQMSERMNTPVVILRTPEEIQAYARNPREAKAKGISRIERGSSRVSEIAILLPNNADLADVENTFVHEAMGHDGLRLLFPTEELLNNALDEMYNASAESIKANIDERAQRMFDNEVDRLTREKGGGVFAAAEAHVEARGKREQFRRDATEEYGADLSGKIGEKGFEKMLAEEQTFWGKLKSLLQKAFDNLLRGLKIPKMRKWTDKQWAFIYKEGYKMKKSKGKMSFADEAESTLLRRKSGYDADEKAMFRDPDMGLEETITRMKAEAMQSNADNLQAKRDAMRAIGGNLNHLRQAMARQREYDIATAKSIKDLATILMDKGLLDGFARHEVEGILVAMNNAIGRQDISKQVDRVFDIMVRNQLRAASEAFGKLTSIRGSRVDARGIKVQGQLDVNGQKMVKALNDAKRLDEDTILERIADATDRMSDSSQTIADNASIEYVGLKFALEYVQNITKSKIEEDEMRKALKTAEEDKNAGRMSKDAYKQLVAATEESIRRNKLDRAEAYFNLIGKLTESMQGSIESAKAFREAEKERIGSIHHFANSDLQGLPAYTTGRRNKKGHTKKSDKVVNALASTILAPLGTFEQYCRLIGSKSVDGRGYIYEHFVVGMQECRDKEWEDRERVEGSLNDKAASILGKKKAKWIDLKALTRKHAGVVEWMDGGEMRNHLITQGNIMAIYMWNKQDDGRVKLRAMGITEEDVEYAVEALDPKLKEVADWIQDEFLVDFRDEINPTYERVNGASMDAIENYFPIKTLANAREEKEDTSNYVDNDGLPKTMTGSLIKRKFNVCALDIMNSDPIDIVIDHVRENIEWKNMVELRRDLGTLLSYKLFRNRMKNMSTIYGAGERNWKHFKKCAMLVGGAYKPHTGDFDKAMVNMTKLATGACIALNFNSAIKQLLSYPAFAKDASVLRLLYNATPHRARMCWNWAMDNMPAFRRRWNSRQGGNDILRDWDGDWDWTKSEFIQKLQRAGLSPNAFVDALTISMGSEAVFHSSYKRYMRDGFSKEVSHQRAILDAEIIFNLSQQSSELSYLSLLQNDRSYITMSFTNFRNSSMSYTRQQVQAARELYNLTMHREEQLEFETKKAMREGLSEEQARTRAKRKYNRQWAKAISGLGIFAVILPALWKFGLQGAWYSIFGDDDEKKKEYAENALKRGAEFGWMEGLAGGGTVPDLLYSMFQGEEFSFDEETSPATASFADMINAFGRGNKYKGINDGVNFAISIGVGVRPQYVEDVIAAGLDFFEADEKAMRDYQMLMLRLISVPQSQLDDMYFDELGLTGTEVKRMSPAQLAGRYSLYKVRRGNLPTMWMMSDEEIEKAKKPYVDKFNREVKSRLDRLNSDETRALVAEYGATHEKFKAIDKKWDDGRTEEAQREQDELMSNTDMDRYWRVDWYKSEISRLTKELLKTSDKTQADSIVNLMRMEQSRLLEEVGTNAAQ